MARPLKVFRTAIGFHDAYIAAPTKKAALEAWGSDRDLFASGRAEIVTDTKLIKAPLAKPGEVIKVKRGTAREHLAALPPAKPKRARTAGRAKSASERPSPTPRPSRRILDRAEAGLARAKGKRDSERDAIDAEQRRLDARRNALEEKHRRILDRLEDARAEAEQSFEDAVAAWREA